MKKIKMMKKYVQNGSVLIEYIIILSFIACLAVFFSFRSWGLDAHIHNAKQQIIAALGFGDGNNYEVAIVDKNPVFSGSGKQGVTGTINNIANGTEWSWKDLYTNDKTDDNGAACGSFFLKNGEPGEDATKYQQNSYNVSKYAESLLNGIYTGSIATTSWAFTEGCGTNTQSLNLYWSNYDWSQFTGSNKQIPILQMCQEKPKDKNSPVNYYVAYANLDSNGNIALNNEAAALKGNVTYISPSGDKVTLKGDKKTEVIDIQRFETSSNQLDSSLAYSDFNSAQAAYMKAVQEFNQNNPGHKITMTP